MPQRKKPKWTGPLFTPNRNFSVRKKLADHSTDELRGERWRLLIAENKNPVDQRKKRRRLNVITAELYKRTKNPIYLIYWIHAH